MSDATPSRAASDAWPALPLASWADTHATLHLWLQIVGKVRLVLSPPQNHCWNATLYVTASGLTTSSIPHPAGAFMIDFDFRVQRLVIRTEEGADGGFALAPMSVASFHARTMDELARAGSSGAHQSASQRGGRPDPVRAGRGAPRVRRRARGALLAHPRARSIAC